MEKPRKFPFLEIEKDEFVSLQVVRSFHFWKYLEMSSDDLPAQEPEGGFRVSGINQIPGDGINIVLAAHRPSIW